MSKKAANQLMAEINQLKAWGIQLIEINKNATLLEQLF
jgi:hypothetical protein